MSPRSCRWLLWAVFVVAVPLPMVSPLSALVPAARMLMMAALSVAAILVETSRGAIVPLAILFLLQAFAAMAVLWVAAYITSRFLSRLSPGMRSLATIAIVVLIVVAATTSAPYRDPYRPGTLHSNLFEVYE